MWWFLNHSFLSLSFFHLILADWKALLLSDSWTGPIYPLHSTNIHLGTYCILSTILSEWDNPPLKEITIRSVPFQRCLLGPAETHKRTELTQKRLYMHISTTDSHNHQSKAVLCTTSAQQICPKCHSAEHCNRHSKCLELFIFIATFIYWYLSF